MIEVVFYWSRAWGACHSLNREIWYLYHLLFYHTWLTVIQTNFMCLYMFCSKSQILNFFYNCFLCYRFFYHYMFFKCDFHFIHQQNNINIVVLFDSIIFQAFIFELIFHSSFNWWATGYTRHSFNFKFKNYQILNFGNAFNILIIDTFIHWWSF